MYAGDVRHRSSTTEEDQSNCIVYASGDTILLLGGQ